MNIFEKKNNFKAKIFFQKNSKFFSKIPRIFFSEDFLQKWSDHAKTARNRIKKIFIKGSSGFIRVHPCRSGLIRVHPLSCGFQAESCGVMRVHAGSCGFMRVHAGSCGNMRGDDNL